MVYTLMILFKKRTFVPANVRFYFLFFFRKYLKTPQQAVFIFLSCKKLRCMHDYLTKWDIKAKFKRQKLPFHLAKTDIHGDQFHNPEFCNIYPTKIIPRPRHILNLVLDFFGMIKKHYRLRKGRWLQAAKLGGSMFLFHNKMKRQYVRCLFTLNS